MKKTKHHITPSDWIAFLQGEISHVVSIMFPLLTAMLIIYIALIQLNQSVGSELLPVSIKNITIFLFCIIFVFAFVIGLETKPLRKLLKKIVKEELTTYEEIFQEYQKIQERDKIRRRKLMKIAKNKRIKEAKKDTNNWTNDPAFVKTKT